MLITPLKTRIFKENESLVDFIIEHVPAIKDGSILIVTSKIVALSEGRVMAISSEEQKDEIIQAESQYAIKTPWCWLTIKDGLAMPSAGVDESNADGKLILLPKNSYLASQLILDALKIHYQLKNLAVIITDSRTLPLRRGTVGVAMGYAGIKGLKDYRGQADMFGRPFKMTTVTVVDALASAAVITMGEGKEQQPLALIEQFEVEFTDHPIDPKELSIDMKDDMYAPLFKGFKI